MCSRRCMWCDKWFSTRQEGSQNKYALDSAGTQICWSCADLFQVEMIKLHQASVKGILSDNQVVTESGHVLPVTLGSWSSSFYRRSSVAFAPAVDLYGNNWNAGLNRDQITLRPAAA